MSKDYNVGADTCPADPQFLNYEELEKEIIGEWLYVKDKRYK